MAHGVTRSDTKVICPGCPAGTSYLRKLLRFLARGSSNSVKRKSLDWLKKIKFEILGIFFIDPSWNFLFSPCSIRCEYEGYTIWLGNKMIGEFKHRLQSSIADTIRISGDVVLYQLGMSYA